MKIQRLHHSENIKVSYKKSHSNRPQNHNIWHHHVELEFIQIIKGSGSVCIADSIQKFKNNDVFLIGSNVPHYWLFDDEYMNGEEEVADIKVIHFSPNFFGQELLQLKEFESIKQLYHKANKGLLISDSDKVVQAFFDGLFTHQGVKQVTKLLETLEYCNTLRNIHSLASQNYSILNNADDYDRINKIMEYIRVNYKIHIQLSALAEHAGMTPNSFCRYFKNRTGKTLLAFLTEIRIASACKQLIENEISIKELCYDCGFNNFVSFHKAFKKITGMTPMQYRAER